MLCRCCGPLLLQPYFAQLNLLFQNKPKSFCLLFIVKQQFNMHSQKLFRSIPTQVFKNFLFQKDIIYLMYKAKNNDSFISIVLKKICKLIFSIMYVGSMHFCQGWVEPVFQVSVLKDFDCPVKGLHIALDLILKYFDPYQPQPI